MDGTKRSPGPRAARAEAGQLDREPGPAGGEDADALVDRVMQVARRMQHSVGLSRSMPVLAVNLTMQQFKTLIMLFRRGPSSGQDLTRVLGVGLATVTGIVDRLAAQGLVTRREDPRDRRVRLVELSPAGREMINGIMTEGESNLRRVLHRLDADTLRMMEVVLGRLVEAAQAELDAED